MLTGKKFLITGITNKQSIAYGIAKSMYDKNAILAFSYKNKKIKNRIKLLANDFNSNIVIPCDVSEDINIKKLFFDLKKKWKKFDGFIHSIAYADKKSLNGNFIKNLNKNQFSISHEITSYSFSALAKESIKMLNPGSSLITISFLGSSKVIPNYNVMGLAKASLESNVRYMAYALSDKNIRVNAISAPAIKTVSSVSIYNFKQYIKQRNKNSLFKSSITTYDIGNVASFLCSDLSKSISGQVIYSNGGDNIV
ncbi:SDR family oxidoreductase [Buchnera aphidicola (Kurisakia onigurumii)]|uniref:enoyl-ACP reductase FabI n=1 Tax=Buchnera aphidicola TaxID=9 RepID=UPI0031B6F088